MEKIEKIKEFFEYLVMGDIVLTIGAIYFYFTNTNILSALIAFLMIIVTLITMLIKNYYSKITKDD